jgi:signal recognition particle receptor subunit beta
MFYVEPDKLIFTGPVAVGKSTAIACISDIPAISTDVAATDETLLKKQRTTVAMDYGFMGLDDGHYVHLYGTPGQERFNFMWDILIENGMGLVVLIDASAEDPVRDLDLYLDHFADFVKKTAAVVGITRSDLVSREVFLDIHHRLQQRRQKLPLFEIDAREPADVRVLIHALLAEVTYSNNQMLQ